MSLIHDLFHVVRIIFFDFYAIEILLSYDTFNCNTKGTIYNLTLNNLLVIMSRGGGYHFPSHAKFPCLSAGT